MSYLHPYSFLRIKTGFCDFLKFMNLYNTDMMILSYFLSEYVYFSVYYSLYYIEFCISLVKFQQYYVILQGGGLTL